MTRRFTLTIAASGVLAAAACAQRPATTNTAPANQPQATVAGDSGMRGMRGEGRRGMGGERMEAMMFEGITLTDAQKAQVDSLRASHRGEMEGLDPRNNPGDRQKMMQMMQAHMAEVRALLTPEQQVVFDRNVQQMRDRRAERGGGAPPRD